MNKCFNCGAEFEGNVCPVCETPATTEITCPVCGTRQSIDSPRCEKCGYSFEYGTRGRQTYPEEAVADNRRRKMLKILSYVPSGAFLLFSVLLFLLCLAPVTTGFPVNLYQMIGDLGSAAALIAFAVLSLLAAAVGILLLPFPGFDLAKRFERPVGILRTVWTYLPFLFYFILYSIGCSLSFLGGAFEVLLILFCLLFALVHAACLLLPRLLKR